jgi:hypothetical protein
VWTNYRSNIAFWIITIFFVVVTNLFIAAGYNHSTSQSHYTGVNFFATSDKLVYYSQIEQGRQGIIMMKNLHTSEPQKGLFFSPHWWLIGQTGYWLGLSNDIVYNVYRILLVILMVGLLWFVSKKLFSSFIDQLAATFVVLFSTGWGWLFSYFQPATLTSRFNIILNKPVDLYVTEMAPLSNSGQSPLFILSHIMLVSTMMLVLLWRHQWSWQRATILAGMSAFLVIMHPYDFWIVMGVMGLLLAYKLWRGAPWSLARYFLAVTIGLILGALYVYLGLQSDLAISGWSKQNLVYSPPLYNYIVGLGWLVPLWVVGLYEVVKRKYDSIWWLWIAIWSVAIWFLLYLPFDYNRRFANAWQIPLGFVAYLGLRRLGKQLKSIYARGLFYALSIMLLCTGSFYSLWLPLQQFPIIANDQRFFLNDDLHQTFNQLKQETNDRAIFLSSNNDLNLLIPAYTGRRVFVGHAHQTVNFVVKEQQSNEFWSGSTGMDRQAFLRDNHISYLMTLYDEGRGASYYHWLEQQPYLQKKYSYTDGAVYKVILPIGN